MALQMNIWMDGISIDPSNPAHKAWVEVLSWNWGMTSNRKLAQGNGEDKTSLNELSIVKSIGTDSPQTRLFFAQGRVIPNVELSVIPKVGKRETPSKYVNLKLENVVIKSIVTGGNTEDSFFKEHITLLFDRIKFEYSKTRPTDGNVAGGVTEDYDFGWNIPINAEW
jgi:type VI secretion system secreted protein Hcp